jgi:hypothetical protein
MSVSTELVHRLGRSFQRVGTKLLSYKKLTGIWIDVGFHLGEKTLQFARENPSLIVYAFEPNIRLASHFVNTVPNVVLIPMAVAEDDGGKDPWVKPWGLQIERVERSLQRPWPEKVASIYRRLRFSMVRQRI